MKDCQRGQECRNDERQQYRKPKAQMKADARNPLWVSRTNNALRERAKKVEDVRNANHEQVTDALNQRGEDRDLEIGVGRQHRGPDAEVCDESENPSHDEPDIVAKAAGVPP